MSEASSGRDTESRRDFLFQSLRRLARLGTAQPATASSRSASVPSSDVSSGGPSSPSAAAPAASLPAPPPAPAARNPWPNRREQMLYAPLGRMGFMASRFAFGARDFAALGPEGFDAALDRGVNLLVTSAESIAACPWLADRIRERRADLWIAHRTSADAPLFGRLSMDPHARPWFDAGRLREEVRTALLSLPAPIDILLLGGIDHAADLADADLAAEIRHGQHENQFRHAGVALDSPDESIFQAALDAEWIDVVLIPFNALNFRELSPLIVEAIERGIGVLSSRSTRGIVQQAADQPLELVELPADLNAHELAYLYMLRKGPQTALVCNFGIRKNLERTLALASLSLDAARADELDAVVEIEIWPSPEIQASLAR